MPSVDFSAYSGREQAYVKHCLLEEYLPEWGWKVGAGWDSLVYVDGFAGPWETKTPNFADSSFGVAVSALDKVAKGFETARERQLGVQCVLVEKDSDAFSRLSDYTKTVSRPRFQVEAIHGEFVDQIDTISKQVRKAGSKPFKFVFLDPKGWNDIPMLQISEFLKDRSCEVLINLMTRFITRFLDESTREESYHRLFGRPEVLQTLRAVPPAERADLAVREYCRSLQTLCDFDYVSSAVILEPNREDKRYFLVYATHHHRGVEVFKRAESKAAQIQDLVRYDARIQKTGQPEFFLEGTPRSRVSASLWRSYCEKAKDRVYKQVRSARGGSVPYRELYCAAMAFPLVTPKDLERWLDELGDEICIDLEGGGKRRKPSPDKADVIRVK